VPEMLVTSECAGATVIVNFCRFLGCCAMIAGMSAGYRLPTAEQPL
jgi:hypothetical protein